MNYQELITNILSEDSEISKSSLATLKSIQQNSEYFSSLLNLMKTSSDIRIVKYCALQVSSSLTAYTDVHSVWLDLDAETQLQVKNDLISTLEACTDKSASRILAHVLAGISCMLSSTEIEIGEADTKIDLMPKVIEYIGAKNDLKTLIALWIMADIFENSEQDFSEQQKTVYNTVKGFFDSKDIEIQLAAVNVVATFLTQINPKKSKKFAEYIPTIFKIIYQGVETGGKVRETAFDVLHFFIENTPQFFKSNIKDLLQLTQNISTLKDLTSMDKQTNLLSIVNFCEQFTEGVENDPEIIKSILNLILSVMKSSEPDQDETWNNLIELNISDTDVGFCANLIQRLLETLGEDIIIPIISELLLGLAKSNEWRAQYAALIEFGYLGPSVQEINSLDPLINLVIKLFNSKLAKVRFAALHAIIQLSSDLAPEFQNKFFKVLYQDMAALLKDENPRVVSACFGAIGSFLEGLGDKNALKATELIFRDCMANLSQGSIPVKIAALSCIGAAAKGTGADFKIVFDQVVGAVFESLNAKDQPRLRLSAFEAITMIIDAVGEEMYSKISNQVLEVGINLLESSKASENTLHFIFSGWQRIGVVMKKDFGPKISTIMPKMITLIEEEGKNCIEEDEEILKDQEIIETAKGNEKASTLISVTKRGVNMKTAILMLHTFAEYCPAELSVYVEKIIPILLPLINHKNAEEIGIPATECVKALLKSLKNVENSAELTKTQAGVILEGILNEIERSKDSETILESIAFLKEIFDENTFQLDDTQINLFSEKIYGMIRENLNNRDDIDDDIEEYDDDEEEPDTKKADKKPSKGGCGHDHSHGHGHGHSHSHSHDEEDEEDVIDLSPIEELDEILIGTSELISSFIKSQKSKAIKTIQSIFDEFVSAFIESETTIGMKKFVIFIIDEALLTLSLDDLGSYGPTMCEILFKYGTDEDYSVRQAAVYGIGVLASRCGSYFVMVRDQSLKVLNSSLLMEKDPEGDDELYGNFRDNAIASVGKIIKHQSENLTDKKAVIDEWVNQLPLKFDVEEALEQHDILLDLILADEKMTFLSENGKRAKKVVEIFVEVADKMLKSETKEKIKRVAKFVKESEGLKELVEGLEENKKKKFEKL